MFDIVGKSAMSICYKCNNTVRNVGSRKPALHGVSVPMSMGVLKNESILLQACRFCVLQQRLCIRQELAWEATSLCMGASTHMDNAAFEVPGVAGTLSSLHDRNRMVGLRVCSLSYLVDMLARRQTCAPQHQARYLDSPIVGEIW